MLIAAGNAEAQSAKGEVHKSVIPSRTRHRRGRIEGQQVQSAKCKGRFAADLGAVQRPACKGRFATGLRVSILVMAIGIAACGGAEKAAAPEKREFPKYRYAAAAELTRDYVSSQDGRLRVLRPEGWRKTSDPKNAPSILLWLVREDYAASISFTPLQMDPALYETLRKEGMESVAKVSLSLKERNAEDSIAVVQPVELFKVGDRICAGYEYRAGSAEPVIRVVVFDSGSGFMECVMYPASVSVTPAENRRLFEVQQSVLASMVAR